MAADEPTSPDQRAPLVVEVDEHERASVVRVAGELDADQAPALRKLLAEQVLVGPGHVVLDVAGLTFIDSSGLATLIAVHKGTRSAGTSLVLADPSPAIVKVLGLTGLQSVLHTAPSVEQALDGLPAARR